jgi:hypothetical protein
MTQRDDQARDAYLRSALQHAPDAGVQPPVALSDGILRASRVHAQQAQQAQQALQGGRAPGTTLHASTSPWLRLRTWWQAPWAMPASAGLGVAVLVASLWRMDAPPAEAEKPALQASAAQVGERSVPPAAPVQQAPAASLAEATLAPPPLTPPTTTVAHASARAPAATTPSQPTAVAKVQPGGRHTTPGRDQPNHDRTLTQAKRRDDSQERAQAAAAPAVAAAPAITAAPLMPTDPAAASVSARVAQAPLLQATQMAARADVAVLAPALLAPMAAVRPSSDGAGFVVSWTDAGGSTKALADGGVQAWAQTLHAATRGHWMADTAAPVAEPTAVQVNVVRQQAVVATVVIGPTSVQWWEAAQAGGRRWRAVLSAEQSVALRAALR